MSSCHLCMCYVFLYEIIVAFVLDKLVMLMSSILISYIYENIYMFLCLDQPSDNGVILDTNSHI